MSKKGNHKTTVLEYSSIVRIVVSIIVIILFGIFVNYSINKQLNN